MINLLFALIILITSGCATTRKSSHDYGADIAAVEKRLNERMAKQDAEANRRVLEAEGRSIDRYKESKKKCECKTRKHCTPKCVK